VRIHADTGTDKPTRREPRLHCRGPEIGKGLSFLARPQAKELVLSVKDSVHISFVVGSGSEMNDAMASPGVTSGSSVMLRRINLGEVS
jgi:hypothetical protein